MLGAVLFAACGEAVDESDDVSLGREGGLIVATRSGPAELFRLEDARRLAVLDLGRVRGLQASRDGAVAFALNDDGAVIVDSGMRWYVHGSHYHVRAGQPRVLPHRVGPGPLTGLVSARGRFVLFGGEAAEGRARALQLFEDDLPNDTIRLERYDLGPWHVGMAAPVAGAVVASSVSSGSPGLSVFEASGAERSIETRCTVSGSAVSTHDAALVGCVEGLVRVARSGDVWSAETLPWPNGQAAEEFSLHASRPVIVGRTSDGLVRYDDVTRRFVSTPAGVGIVRAGVDRSDAPMAVALLEGGRLMTVREGEGATPSISDIGALGAGDAPLAVGRGRAYVAAGGGTAVLEVSLLDGAVTRRFDVPAGVTHLALVGHKWFNVPDRTAKH